MPLFLPHHNPKVIGAMFIMLVISIVVVSSVSLARHQSPDSTVSGLIVTVISASVMCALWLVKRHGAKLLDSVGVLS